MDLICFSHLRWDFVFQRPQHLMTRLTAHFRVFYIEEPIYGSEAPFLDTKMSKEGVWIVVPHLPHSLNEDERLAAMESLLQDLFKHYIIENYLFWYYTPMAIMFTSSFAPEMTVYDCMDELSAFKNAPWMMQHCEKELMRRAGIVFTGGKSLYEAKKDLHPNIFAFPSSIDKLHFIRARYTTIEPPDQVNISHPRIGFFGVIDERMDIDLLREAAILRPEWNFIILGPTVKIDPATLPILPNIHYLGGKQYNELPDYLGGWDVAMMPFALNESTRFISPTKTPEYLAGGKPVVSTAIKDVVDPYGINGLVYIADSPNEFVEGIENALSMDKKDRWLGTVDSFLANNSWDNTVEKMLYHINSALQTKNTQVLQKEEKYV